MKRTAVYGLVLVAILVIMVMVPSQEGFNLFSSNDWKKAVSPPINNTDGAFKKGVGDMNDARRTVNKGFNDTVGDDLRKQRIKQNRQRQIMDRKSGLAEWRGDQKRIATTTLSGIDQRMDRNVGQPIKKTLDPNENGFTKSLKKLKLW